MLAAALVLLLWQTADIALPPPDLTDKAPLMRALQDRKSTREFAQRKLPRQVLSNLLWAAYGINRAKEGGRTSPSAFGWHAVDVFVALEEGLYRYEAGKHTLVLVASKDARAIAGTQDFTANAPLNLLFVADMSRTKKQPGDTDLDTLSWVSAEAGAISQNVSLYCASAGLGTVVRAGVQRDAFAKLAGLTKDHNILLAQTVGYPSKPK